MAADQALSWGLTTHVVGPVTLVVYALEMAQWIAQFPPRSLRLNKRLIRRSVNMTLDGSLELSAAFQAIVQNTAEQKEALNALLEKRASDYCGR